MSAVGAFTGPDAPSLEALRSCVHCGICLPQCPTYRVLGEEMDSPRGRLYLMRAAAEGRADLTETFARHMDLCLGCRACESACPSGVPFGSLLEATRAQLVGRGRERWMERLTGATFPRPDRVRALVGALRLYQRSGVQRLVRASGLLRAVPVLSGMDALLPMVPAGDSLPERLPATGRRRGTAGMLAGCVQRHFYPEVNRATAHLLSLAGWDVLTPREQGCCGALDLHGGRLADFRARARRLVGAFPAGVDVVAVNAAGCGATMKAYDHWLAEPDAAAFASKVRDVSEVLVDAELPLGPVEMTATYHDACHLAHGQKIRSAPRALLARVPGLTMVPLADSDLCCGSAGIYNLVEPAMAARLLEMKIERIAETRATAVVAGNPGCLLQIAKGCRARGLGLEVLHPVQVLARSVARRTTNGAGR